MLYLRRMRRHSVGGPPRRIRAFFGFAVSSAISAEQGAPRVIGARANVIGTGKEDWGDEIGWWFRV
jgi:hypothetical protein